MRLDQGDIDWDEVASLAAISYNLVAAKGLRELPVPLANALTSRSLMRGAPPSDIPVNQGQPSPVQIVDGHLLHAEPITAERSDRGQSLRPTAVPGAAIIRPSGGLRGRR
jgi:hypothetical protein